MEADGGAGDGADLGARVLAAAAHEDARGHGAFLAPAVAACLAEAGLDVAALDGVAVGTGPGLYTGLRIGMATASALAWARGLPIAGGGGLDAMVVAARRDPDLAVVPLVAVLDAIGLVLLVPLVEALSDADRSPDLPILGEVSVEVLVELVVGFFLAKTLAASAIRWWASGVGARARA
ncbi:MAG: tRNA (adenosine(37)-N6)-threonylcarbamoyltransferase complex dimerization subunit type 1 TsaB, partial [Nitriliruptoraceae bacterium]